MSDLLKLAERCEAATGPDRELDAVIADVVDDQTNCGGGTARYLRSVGNSHHDIATYCSDLRAFTASLDAAMTLVPEGWHFGMLTECDEDNSPIACLTENEEPCRDVVGKGVNMTLSLVAAALRAREEDRG